MADLIILFVDFQNITIVSVVLTFVRYIPTNQQTTSIKQSKSLPQTLFLWSLYPWNQMLYTLDISNCEFCYINILNLKYQRFTTSGSKYIRVWIFEFVAKTQSLYIISRNMSVLNLKKSKSLKIGSLNRKL